MVLDDSVVVGAILVDFLVVFIKNVGFGVVDLMAV